MSQVSPAVVAALWDGLAQVQARRNLPRSEEPKRPMSAEELVAKMPGYMAWAWLRRNKTPNSVEALTEALAADPTYNDWLTEMHCSALGLAALPADTWGWRLMDPRDSTTWPEDGQAVFYFFEVVGSHAGTFAGQEREPSEEDHTGGAGFAGAYGFLDLYDVACWAPRPVAAL